jgi:hypothetical protein
MGSRQWNFSNFGWPVIGCRSIPAELHLCHVQLSGVRSAQLSPEQQHELFKWWVESDAFKQRQLAALKTEIALGTAQLAEGRYTNYDDSTVMQLAEEVNRASRQRLERERTSGRE